jgi:tetratricopeptide (TPR) repeat protein
MRSGATLAYLTCHRIAQSSNSEASTPSPQTQRKELVPQRQNAEPTPPAGGGEITQPNVTSDAGQQVKRESPAAIRTRYGEILKGRDFGNEIMVWTRVLAANPNDARGHVARGSTYRLKGDYELALSDYNRAIELDPKLANAYTNRGLNFLWQNEIDKAIADFDRALALEPGNALARRQRDDAIVARQSPSNFENPVSPAIKQMVELVRQGNELFVKHEWGAPSTDTVVRLHSTIAISLFCA